MCLRMTQNIFNKSLLKIKGHVKYNWGSPFVVMFMLLLLSATIPLSIGFSSLANNIAIYAYFALVVGVTLQLFCFLKYRQRGESESV
jgi:hypothetical protein